MKKKINYVQLQNALHAFDFLHKIPIDQERENSLPRPQISLEGDLFRPVLSMPPVILMDNSIIVSNYGGGGHSPRSMPQSPIVEMPPSPAPSQMHDVEFPSEEDVYEYDEQGVLVEVCCESKSCNFFPSNKSSSFSSFY